MRTLSFMKCTRRTAHLSGSNLKWPDFRSHITANTRHVSFVYAYLLHWATLDSLQHSPRTQRAKSSSCRPSKTMTFLNECWRDAPNLFLFSFFFTFTLQKSVPILHGWFWQQIYNKYTYQNKKMWKKKINYHHKCSNLWMATSNRTGDSRREEGPPAVSSAVFLVCFSSTVRFRFRFLPSWIWKETASIGLWRGGSFQCGSVAANCRSDRFFKNGGEEEEEPLARRLF